jgi:hypothetical protein
MSRELRSIAIVLLALPLLGMGALGGGATGATPERNYQGKFVDRDGTTVDAKWITAGGELALSGQLGLGELRIPFDNIKAIRFTGDATKGVVADVALRQGNPVEMKVRSTLEFAGQTQLGTYRIRARDLKSVEFESE